MNLYACTNPVWRARYEPKHGKLLVVETSVEMCISRLQKDDPVWVGGVEVEDLGPTPHHMGIYGTTKAERDKVRKDAAKLLRDERLKKQKLLFGNASRGHPGKLIQGLRNSGATFKDILRLSGHGYPEATSLMNKWQKIKRYQAIIMRGRVNCSVPNERDKWHEWTPEKQYFAER